jgi:hypothetical protein
MDKLKAGFKTAWALLAEGYDIVTGFIGRHPHWVFWLGLSYVLIRR